MRKIFTLLFLSCFLAACNNNRTSSESVKDSPGKLLEKALGSFVGIFGDNKITLLITKAEGSIVEGRSIVGGNDRPFTGTIKEKDGTYSIQAREPGDDPNDGIFSFTMESANPDIITGSWKPFDSKKAAKDYTLQRRAFKYRIDVGEYPEAAQRELKPEDVENLMKPELEWMRNEIFARHGYCFRKKSLREIFEQQEWYIPDNTDVRDHLTAIEKKNIELIKRYEKYAEDYGDEFGR
jgi:hypothetical protein